MPEPNTKRRRRRGGRRHRKHELAEPRPRISRGQCRAHRCDSRADENAFFCEPHYVILPPSVRGGLSLNGSIEALRKLHECVQYICRREHRADFVRLRILHQKIEACYKAPAVSAAAA